MFLDAYQGVEVARGGALLKTLARIRLPLAKDLLELGKAVEAPISTSRASSTGAASPGRHASPPALEVAGHSLRARTMHPKCATAAASKRRSERDDPLNGDTGLSRGKDKAGASAGGRAARKRKEKPAAAVVPSKSASSKSASATSVPNPALGVPNPALDAPPRKKRRKGSSEPAASAASSSTETATTTAAAHADAAEVKAKARDTDYLEIPQGYRKIRQFTESSLEVADGALLAYRHEEAWWIAPISGTGFITVEGARHIMIKHRSATYSVATTEGAYYRVRSGLGADSWCVLVKT